MQEKIFSKIEVKNKICINVFGYEHELGFPIYVSDQKFEDSIYFLLLIGVDKSHYAYFKDFDRFMFHKRKSKNKRLFCKSCLQCFSSEYVLIKHKENCLNINGKQSVKLKKGIIEFENYFKQIPVPFKIYADFKCNLWSVESYEGSFTKKIKIVYLVVLVIKQPIAVYKNAAYEITKVILKGYKY